MVADHLKNPLETIIPLGGGVYLFCLQFLSFTSSFCPGSNSKYRRHRRLWRERSGVNSALVALQRLLWFLNFWDAAASGTIPAAGPGSRVEVPTQGTVPGWLRKGNLFLPSRQGQAAEPSSVRLRAWDAFGGSWSWELCSGQGSSASRGGRRHWDVLTITCCPQALTAEGCEQELQAGGTLTWHQ